MKLLSKIKGNKHIRRVLVVTGCAILLFAVANLILGYIYYGKTYPGTTIQNHKVGSKSENSLQNNLASVPFLPATVELSYKDQSAKVDTKDLGVQVDNQKTAEQAVSQKSWLPIWNFISPPKVDVKVAVTEPEFNNESQQLAQIFKKEPANAKIQLENGNFVVIKEVDGYELNKDALQNTLQTALSKGQSSIEVPVSIIQPSVKETDLGENATDLIERTKVPIVYKFGNKTHELTAAEISNLHEPNETSYILSEVKIRSFIKNLGKSWGISVKNVDELARDSKSAIQNKKPLEATLIEAPKKTYNYCVALRGVDGSELSGFQNKVNQVLNDDKSWSLDGQVEFNKVDSGCSFTVWLSAANQLPSFGAICDSMWSCAVAPNVIINYDRWKNASSAWNQNGGSLEDYRAMAINHETGHWLGFGHRNCGGTGQPAPVMQQQSIDLQGCKFNSWPNQSERETLKKNLGL